MFADECLRLVFAQIAPDTSQWLTVRILCRRWKSIADREFQPGWLAPWQAYFNPTAMRKYANLPDGDDNNWPNCNCRWLDGGGRCTTKSHRCPMTNRVLMAAAKCRWRTIDITGTEEANEVWRSAGGWFYSDPWPGQYVGEEALRNLLPLAKSAAAGYQPWSSIKYEFAAPVLYHRDWVNLLARCLISERFAEFNVIWDSLPADYCPLETVFHVGERLDEDIKDEHFTEYNWEMKPIVQYDVRAGYMFAWFAVQSVRKYLLNESKNIISVMGDFADFWPTCIRIMSARRRRDWDDTLNGLIPLPNSVTDRQRLLDYLPTE